MWFLKSVGCEPGPSTRAPTRTWATVNVRPRLLVRQTAAVRDRKREKQKRTDTREDTTSTTVSNNDDNDGYLHLNLSESSVIFIIAQKHFLVDTLFCRQFILPKMAEEVVAAGAKPNLQEMMLPAMRGTVLLARCSHRMTTDTMRQASWSAWTKKTATAVTRHRASAVRCRRTPLCCPRISRSIPSSTKLMRKTKNTHTVIFHLLSMFHQQEDPAPPFSPRKTKCFSLHF